MLTAANMRGVLPAVSAFTTSRDSSKSRVANPTRSWKSERTARIAYSSNARSCRAVTRHLKPRSRIGRIAGQIIRFGSGTDRVADAGIVDRVWRARPGGADIGLFVVGRRRHLARDIAAGDRIDAAGQGRYRFRTRYAGVGHCSSPLASPGLNGVNRWNLDGFRIGGTAAPRRSVARPETITEVMKKAASSSPAAFSFS